MVGCGPTANVTAPVFGMSAPCGLVDPSAPGEHGRTIVAVTLVGRDEADLAEVARAVEPVDEGRHSASGQIEI